ncbi:MAG: phosphoenolpyruvate carboxylase [Nanoarchaeota archaeon]
MSAVKIPRCMSTQHPDNVNSPFFAESSELGGEDEIQEAFYVFSHLGCDEQMWDCEGKEVDNYVVKKLLTRYEQFFRTNRLGRDKFITLRVPNPAIERAEAKILLETLESIPRSFDTAKLFYKDDNPPIFEVILPMTTSAMDIEKIYKYYTEFVAGKQDKNICDTALSEWIGEFKPKGINVIPLFEDMAHMIKADGITGEYLRGKDIQHQRVFLARSDPAMNYGMVSAVLLNKIALQRLHKMSEETGVAIYPIIGVGSAPFRGNLKPGTAERVAGEYPSVHTFTLQSAFKYDNPHGKVVSAVKKLSKRKTGKPHEVDEEKCMEIIRKCTTEYTRQIAELAPLINKIAKYVPSRRKRKMHIGLFGYSRNVEGITLPRAITFTAALYSLGLPPEILGLSALNKDDVKFIKDVFVHFEDDLNDALRYLNPCNTGFLPDGIEGSVQIDEEHRDITGSIKRAKEHGKNSIEELVLRAAHLRGFLG